jgi:septum formation protein
VILGADTEVVLDGRYMGKPRDATDAVRILSALGGKDARGDHRGGPGRGPTGREATAAVTTRVTMAAATQEEIAAYVATGRAVRQGGRLCRPGLGAQLVAHVDGCLSNVVGLPVETTRRLLEAWDLL